MFPIRLKDKNKQYDHEMGEGFAGAQYGAYIAQNEAMATEEMRKGMDLLKEAATKSGNRLLDKKQGNLFEYIESAKFNTAAAKQSSSLRVRVTEALGRPHDKADAEIINGYGQVIKQVQYKSSGDGKGSIARQVREISKPEYKGMQRVVNKDHYDQVKDKLNKAAKRGNIYSSDYQDAAKNLPPGTSAGTVKTSGTTHAEAISAAKKPKTYAAKMELKQGLTELTNTAGQAAIGGLVVGGAISVTKNTLAVYRGEMETGDAISVTCKEAGKSAVKAGVIGGIGSAIRQGAAKLGFKTITKSNVATAVASSVIESGVIVYDLVKGEISGEEAVTRLGQTTTSTISGIYGGAAAGIVFGPVGAVIGSIAGYMLASNTYQSCVAIFQNAQLTEIEAERVIALCEEAALEMKKQREDFEIIMRELLAERHKEFEQCFNLLNKGMIYNSPEISTYALTQLATLVGANLKLASFEEFDDFMINSKESLKL